MTYRIEFLARAEAHVRAGMERIGSVHGRVSEAVQRHKSGTSGGATPRPEALTAERAYSPSGRLNPSPTDQSSSGLKSPEAASSR